MISKTLKESNGGGMVEFKNFLNMKISWDSCDEGSDLETTRKSIKEAIEHVVNEENSSKIGARGGDRGFDLERLDFAKGRFKLHNISLTCRLYSAIL